MASFSELARRQRVMEIGGLPTVNDKRKLIPVKYNRSVQSGDEPVCYDFEGMKTARRNGVVVFEVDQNNTELIHGSRGTHEESPHGFLLVAPTKNNVEKLARMADKAASLNAANKAAIKTHNGSEEYKEVRVVVPIFERIDIEDEETTQAVLDSVTANPKVLKGALAALLSDPEMRAELRELLKTS